MTISKEVLFESANIASVSPNFCYVEDIFALISTGCDNTSAFHGWGIIRDIDWVDPTEQIKKRINVTYTSLVMLPPEERTIEMQVHHIILGEWTAGTEKNKRIYKIMPLRNFYEQKEDLPSENLGSNILKFPIK